MPYLQEAGSRSVVDLDVGGISARQQLAVTEPRNGGARVSEGLAGDVSPITLPGEHRRRALDLWSICNYTQCQPSATNTWTVPEKDLGAKNTTASSWHTLPIIPSTIFQNCNFWYLLYCLLWLLPPWCSLRLTRLSTPGLIHAVESSHFP